ncbi:Creatinase/aminopeptidase [Lichtheimia hyalospora FSU 10163]|nr:Creatinase/aminopeptidase [Lichtheimia hyalospora FSU 10163]
MQSTTRLEALRKAMSQSTDKIDAFVIPSEDAHQSEYTAECDNRRAWISGFTGSAGCAVVTQDTAAMFTDGRYFLQASQELDESWTLMKQGLPGVPNWKEYLVKNLPSGYRIGVDPTVLTAADAVDLGNELAKISSTLVPVGENPVDKIRQDRPARPTNPVVAHDIQFAGKSRETKLDELRKAIREKGYDGTVVSALDEIAWLLNLRGSDIHCCPIFFAYCVVTNNDAVLYIDNINKRLSQDIQQQLRESSIQLRDYDQIFDDLQHVNRDQRFVIDPTLTNLSIVQALNGLDYVGQEPSPITLAKAIKNDAELYGLRECHKRDGAAVSRHFAWLADMLCNQQRKISEADAAAHLEEMRRQNSEYVGMSFDTVAATGPNGAIIHYQPSPTHSAIIDPRQIYLCDSGAHYMDGTTDITRTFLFDGEPTEFQKRAFTRVLQAHIALDQAVFPSGTSGYQLDTLARAPLWQDGLDFRHGTGHGVGAYLNVHEGPHGIGAREAYRQIALQEGMVVTNEPGYYEDGKFGIRIENVLIVKKATTPYSFGDKEYLGFEHATFVPLGRRLLDRQILTDKCRAWINKYHQECRKVLESQLENDRRALEWLEMETEVI